MAATKRSPSREVDVGRRGFFRQALAEAVSVVEELRGRPQRRLGGLAQAPDAVLRAMAPVFFSGVPWRVEDGALWAQRTRKGPFEAVRQVGPEEAFALGLFDGTHTLEIIGMQIAARFSGDPAAGYGRARDLFLDLAAQALCHPAAAHLDALEDCE